MPLQKQLIEWQTAQIEDSVKLNSLQKDSPEWRMEFCRQVKRPDEHGAEWKALKATMRRRQRKPNEITIYGNGSFAFNGIPFNRGDEVSVSLCAPLRYGDGFGNLGSFRGKVRGIGKKYLTLQTGEYLALSKIWLLTVA
jgi:hypothetical protein